MLGSGKSEGKMKASEMPKAVGASPTGLSAGAAARLAAQAAVPPPASDRGEDDEVRSASRSRHGSEGDAPQSDHSTPDLQNGTEKPGQAETHEEVAAPGSEEEMVAEQPEPVDLEDLGRRIMRRMDARVDSEFARIREETTNALGEITKEVSGQLKQNREKLSTQVAEGQAHTQEQMVAAGHTADARHAEATKRRAELSEQVNRIYEMME